MAVQNLNDLRIQINNDIKTNGVRAITGDILNTQLIDMIDSIEADYDNITTDLDTRVTDIESAALLILQDKSTGWDASSGVFPGGGTAKAGFYWNVSGAGTVDGVAFDIGDSLLAVTDNASTTTYASNWEKKDDIDPVISVAGKVGAIILVAADITDFDAEVSNNTDVAANTLKVTNATHTGDVTGSAALTANPVMISNKVNKATLVGTEKILIEDSGVLKHVLASSVGSNLYTADGTLAGPRTVTMAGNSLTFDGGQTTIKGSGSTSGTTALLVQNSLSTNLLEVLDDGSTTIGGNTKIDGQIDTTSSLASQIHTFGTNLSTGLSRFFWNNNNGLAGYIDLLGTSGTLSGNSLMPGAFRITSGGNSNKFIIGNTSTSGDTYFVWGGAENANTDGKWNDTGLLIGNGIGAVNPAANLHVRGEGNSTEKALIIESNLGTNRMLEIVCNNSIGLLGATVGGANTLTVGGDTQIDGSLATKGSGSTSGTTALLVQNSLSSNLLEVKDDGGIFVNGTLEINTGASSNNLKIESTSTAENTTVTFWNASVNTAYVGTFGSTYPLAEAREKLVLSSYGTGQLYVDNSSSEFRWNFGNFPNTNTDMILTPTGLGIGTNVTPTAQLHVAGTTYLAGNTQIDGEINISSNYKLVGTTNFQLQNSASTSLLTVQNDGSTTINGNTLINGSLEVNTGVDVNILKVESTSTAQSTTISFWNGGTNTAYIGTFGSTSSTTTAREKLVLSSYGTGQLYVDNSSSEFRWNFGGFADTSTDMLLTPTGLGIGTNVTPTAQLHVNGTTFLNGNTDIDGTLEINTGASSNNLKIESTSTAENTAVTFWNASLNTAYVGTFGSTYPLAEAREKLVLWSNTAGKGHLYLDNSSTGFRWNFGAFADTSTDMLLTPTGLGLGTNLTPTAKLHVQGSGSTSGTTALLVQNSLSTNLLEVKDDGDTAIGTTVSTGSKLRVGGNLRVEGFVSSNGAPLTFNGGDVHTFKSNSNSTALGVAKFTWANGTTAFLVGNGGSGVLMDPVIETGLSVKGRVTTERSLIIGGYNNSLVKQFGVTVFGKLGLGVWGTDRLTTTLVSTAGFVNIPASTVDEPNIYIESGVDLTSPNEGAIWKTATDLNFRINSQTVKLYQETTGVGSALLGTGGGTGLTDLDTFDGYTLQQVVKALRNLGILA